MKRLFALVLLVAAVSCGRGNSELTLTFNSDVDDSCYPQKLAFNINPDGTAIINGDIFLDSLKWSKITISGAGASSVVFTIDEEAISEGKAFVENGISERVVALAGDAEVLHCRVLNRIGEYEFSWKVPDKTEPSGITAFYSPAGRRIKKPGRTGIGSR